MWKVRYVKVVEFRLVGTVVDQNSCVNHSEVAAP